MRKTQRKSASRITIGAKFITATMALTDGIGISEYLYHIIALGGGISVGIR